MKIRVTAILVTLILTVVAGRAQQTPAPAPTPQSIDTPVFRANVDAVELDAFVKPVRQSCSWDRSGTRFKRSIVRTPLFERIPSHRLRTSHPFATP